MKILLAEDDKNISTISKMTLEKLGGHEVTVVEDGEQAFNEGLDESYDLILLDEMMPVKNGLTVCGELKEKGVQTPVIFLSARSQKDDIELFESMGLGYISKPFDPSELNQKIMNIVGTKET